VDELKMIADLLTEPPPAEEAVSRGRARLTTVMSTQPATHRSHWRRAAGVIATTAAAGVALSAGLSWGFGSAGHQLSHPAKARHVTAGPPATLAAKVLLHAASQVAREPVTPEPSPRQWIYTKTIFAGDPTPDQEWVTFDASQNAYLEAKPGYKYYVPGQLVVHTADPNPPGPGVPPWTAWKEAPSPMTAYNILASLPSNPQKLLAAVYAHLGMDGAVQWGGVAANKAQAEFNDVIDVLWNVIGRPGGPPAAVAAIYRALATLPGVSVQTGMTDAAGAPAIGISDDGGRSYYLLSPTSYQFIGSVSPSNPHSSTAIAVAAEVPAPGDV
jgi:hypothetical protein